MISLIMTSPGFANSGAAAVTETLISAMSIRIVNDAMRILLNRVNISLPSSTKLVYRIKKPRGAARGSARTPIGSLYERYAAKRTLSVGFPLRRWLACMQPSGYQHLSREKRGTQTAVCLRLQWFSCSMINFSPRLKNSSRWTNPPPPWYHPRRSSHHVEKEEEKEETSPETTGPLDPYAADYLRRNRGDRNCLVHPQPGRVRRRKRSVTIIFP